MFKLVHAIEGTRFIRWILCSLLILLFNWKANAQDNISFTSLSAKDGLSANTVNAILKDSYGLMWFATNDGLNKFDGTSFTIYRQDRTDTSTLRSNRITTLYEDKTGNLWVGTDGGYLSVYNRTKDNFKNLDIPGVNTSVSGISGDAFGKIWVAHFSGLTVIDPVHFKSYTFHEDKNRPDQLSTSEVLSVFHDKYRSVWVGTTDGLFRYNRKTRNFTHYKHNARQPLSLAGDTIKGMIADSKGFLWISTTRGLSKLNLSTLNFETFPNKATDDRVLVSSRMGQIDIDATDELWIATNSGLYIMNTITGQLKNFLPDKRDRHSLSSKALSSVYIDRHLGIYWIGTYHAGISKYDKNLSLFHLKESNPFDPFGLSASRTTSFAAKSDSEIFVGTDGGGLNLFNRNTQLFRRVPINSSGTGLSVQALAIAKDKSLWVATYGDGVFVMSADGSVKQLKRGTGQNQLSSNEVFAIKQDSRGNIWLGTNGGGINVYENGKNRIVKYSANLGNSSPIRFPLNNYIRCIEEDKRGNIWIGSHGSGLAMFDPKSNRFSVYNRTKNNLENDIVMSLLSDRDGKLWVGTTAGLCLLNEDGKFESFNEKNGIANNVIYSIIEGNDSRLWLSTNLGISSFDKATLQFRNYNYHNGLQQSNFVLGAALQTTDGTMFFGGLEGFNYFKPSDIKLNNKVPQIIFTDLKISGRSVSPSDDGYINEHIAVAKTVTLDYKQNFSLSFVALNYTSPKENQYSYKLEGFDKVWSQPSSTHTAYYTNLDPGKYTLLVKARNNDGIWTPQAAAIKITVAPPFWRTVYAYLAYILAVTTLLTWWRYRTLKQLKARFKLEQERKETERIRELDNQKIKFLTNLSHEFRTPISLIIGPIDNLTANPDNDRIAGQLNMIKRNARRLLNMVSQLLDFRKLEENELTLNLTPGDLIAFIKEVAESFSDISERKNIKFSVVCNIDRFYTKFDHDKIERILFNLFSNAFKFTHEDGSITLEVIPDDTEGLPVQNLIIKVSDTGVGIPPDKREKIFERFFQVPTNAAVLNQGTGIGLAITKDFVQMHGGKIEVESTPGVGTTFTIILPVQQANVSEDENSNKIWLQADELEFEEALPDSSPSSVLSDDVELAQKVWTEKPLILLVEDNEDFRQYLKDSLNSCYRIIEASNGKEGWQKALGYHPEMVISDVSMPLMDGIELCRKIKSDKRTSHMPVILLTALTAEDEQVKGLQTGASDYLSKPFNLDILITKIQNLLALNQKLKDTYIKKLKVLTPEVEVESENAKLLNKVMEYIEHNVHNPKFSVSDLSRYVGMSRSSLYNKLLELTGQSPLEFIRNIKLDKAAALLEKSDMNVAQIGYMVGFPSPNYLSRSFKARFGVLPSEYMQMKRKQKSLIADDTTSKNE